MGSLALVSGVPGRAASLAKSPTVDNRDSQYSKSTQVVVVVLVGRRQRSVGRVRF